jgi:hypothetical protein
MTYAGARGETEQQMAQALGFVLTHNRLHPAFSHLTREFASRSEVLPARMNQGQSHRHHPVRRPGCEPRFLTLTPLSAKCKVRWIWHPASAAPRGASLRGALRVLALGYDHRYPRATTSLLKDIHMQASSLGQVSEPLKYCPTLRAKQELHNPPPDGNLYRDHDAHYDKTPAPLSSSRVRWA